MKYSVLIVGLVRTLNTRRGTQAHSPLSKQPKDNIRRQDWTLTCTTWPNTQTTPGSEELCLSLEILDLVWLSNCLSITTCCSQNHWVRCFLVCHFPSQTKQSQCIVLVFFSEKKTWACWRFMVDVVKWDQRPPKFSLTQLGHLSNNSGKATHILSVGTCGIKRPQQT